MAGDRHPLRTPDGRYIVVGGRLWRSTDPSLAEDRRQSLVARLMNARRAVAHAKNGSSEMSGARKQVNDAKTALGERGPVWWDDGSPDLNRRLVRNTPYADWYATVGRAANA